VRYANIAIIEGAGVSRYGIAAVTARLAQAVLRDERAVLPVGAHHLGYRTTVSLPCVVGAQGVQRVIEPPMTSAEGEAMRNSAQILQTATTRCEKELSTLANAAPMWSSTNSNGSGK
jgi:L-lactate dehydrogenase